MLLPRSFQSFWIYLTLATVQLPLHAAEKLSFNRHIRPLLSDRCFYCHGPDEKTREADLRLDTREGALRDLGGYAAVVAGDPQKSELILRVASHDQDELMPPPKSKKAKFTADEIATLRQWIREGAEYEGHWAFLPLSEATPPAPERIEARIKEWEQRDPATGRELREAEATLERWPQNPIDRFVLDRLLQEGLTPSARAEAPVLLRRLSLDLTGLLPSGEEVDRFSNVSGGDAGRATAKLIDSLLASPHYGERWGRHWLDQARYADSNGYSIDGDRTMWPYRDWVIKAINDDLSFDQFTIEQLAGDLLPNPTKAQLVATGFHRNTLINQEGGTDPEQFRVEATIDRVNTTGAVWLGLTVGCAQCHTHKFDPITQREYYELFAFFNQASDRNNAGATVAVRRGELLGREPGKRDRVLSPTEAVNWEAAEAKRIDRIPAKGTEPVWLPAEYLEHSSSSNAGLSRLEDNSLLSDGRGSFNDSYRVLAKTNLPKVGAIRLRVLPHESLPSNGPGLAPNGNFVLTEFIVKSGSTPVRFVRVGVDHEQNGYPGRAASDGDPTTGWAVNLPKGSPGSLNAPHEAIFIPAKPIVSAKGGLEIQLRHDLNQNYLIGRFAIDFTEEIPARLPDEDALLQALRTPAAKRTSAQKNRIGNAVALQSRSALTAQAMVMKDLDEPRPTYLLTRGDFTRPDMGLGELAPGGIEVVSPKLVPERSRTRLDLAKWLVAPDNPLTPRVTVNRVWMRYFGRGLVETEEDFGTQGTPPTHPELLDWLAKEFVRSGWSMKALHKLIVGSATYQQSSAARADAAEKDPRNLLLARQERLRLEGEIIRDAALCASGLLDREIGGPSVRPPQPDGVFAFTQTPKTWIPDTGPNRYRRALYTMFYRSAPYPLLSTFDAPDFQTVCTRRVRSNTPLQSLTLANDPAFLELAHGLASRLVKEVPGASGDVLEARLRRGFLLSLSREPMAEELRALLSFVKREQAALEKDPKAVRALLAGGPKAAQPRASGKVQPAELAALISAARVLFNTDNFITRE